MSDEEPDADAPAGSGSGGPAPAEALGTFSFFSLEGDRYEAPGMPADAGREVAAFRDAIVEIAVDLWKRDHPDRRRAPNGFADAFDLRLTGVEAGSSRPQLHLHRPRRGVGDDEWSDWLPYYNRARDLATRQVHEVETSDAVPADMGALVRRALGRVGGTLDGEARIRFGPPQSAKEQGRATITPRVRDVLRRIDEVLPHEERHAAAVGVLTEYDGERLSFVLKPYEGPRVTCLLEHYNEPLAERARELLALDGVTAPDVRVEGQTLDDDGRVRRIFNVHSLEVVWTVAEKVIVHRLRALTKLRPGWLGPGSDVPTTDLAELLEPVVSDVAALGLPVIIAPSAHGAFVLEWRAGDVEYTAELGPDHRLFMCADNVKTDALDEREIDYDPEVLRRFLTTGSMG